MYKMLLKPPAYTYRARWLSAKKLFCGTCLELPTLYVEAKTINQAMAGIKEAAKHHISSLRAQGLDVPEPIASKKEEE